MNAFLSHKGLTMTRIIVHDTIDLFKQPYLSNAAPKDRFAILSPMLMQKAGLMRQAFAAAATSDAPLAVMAAGGVDGGATLGQQGFGLFNPKRLTSATAAIFDAFRQQTLFDFTEETLTGCAAAMPSAIDEVQVFLFPTDPANQVQMICAHGIAGVALAPGMIVAQVYPTPDGMTRLAAMLARWWTHQVWISAHGVPVMLRDWLIMEGHAAHFAASIVSDLPFPTWMAPFHPAPDWNATLQTIAAHYGLASYDDMTVNTYGQNSVIGSARAPLPEALDPNMSELVESVIKDALDTTIPHVIAAHLYGDAIVERQGHPGAGLPPFAGYAVAASSYCNY